MKHEMSQVREKNLILQENIKGLNDNSTQLQVSVDTLRGENTALSDRFEELSCTVKELQSSEQEMKELVQKLTARIEEGGDQDLKDQIVKLEQLHAGTHGEIEVLIDRLKKLESGLKRAPVKKTRTPSKKK